MNPHSALKHGLLVALATFATPVFASTSGPVRIYERETSPLVLQKSTAFAFNAELGRAWVEVAIEPVAPEDRIEFVRVKVPGLSYDAASGTILFRKDDRVIDCATVRHSGRGLFKRTKIEPTGRCALTHRYVQVPLDDGFAIEEVQRFEVHFEARP